MNQSRWTILRRLIPGFVCGLAVLTSFGASRSAIFVLTNDGQVQGEPVVGPDATPGQTVVRTSSGGLITLDNGQIKQIIPLSANELEYERIRPNYADTAEDQWKLAEWCHKHSLNKQERVHLERVIVLDPDQPDARRLLGYGQSNGHWVRQADAMKEQGYVLYKGQWKLPQEVELLEARRKDELAEKAWFAKLKRWRGALGNRSDDDGQWQEELNSIKTDSTAVPALAHYVERETSDRIKLQMIDVLVRIGSPSALDVVVGRTLDDSSEEIRLSALDKLVASTHRESVPFYVKALKSKDNVRINRAALCLGKLGDKSAIPALINALRTTHTHVEQQGQPGQISTTFGNGPGGGGMSVGTPPPKRVTITYDNHDVLAALLELTGRSGTESFQFDKKAWLTWYSRQKTPANVDIRRD